LNEILRKYLSCESVLLRRFSRSEIKGQGDDQTECYNGGVAVWRGDSLVEIYLLFATQRWPTAEIPNFKSVMVECFEVCSRLAMRVLLAIANGLNMKVWY